VDPASRQINMAGVRDAAVQKLRDVTIAVAIAAAAGVGVIGWVSAATIPGSTGTPGPTGNAATPATPATSGDDQPFAGSGDGFGQGPPAGAQFGSGVAVTGGSH
jgi:hypothetical protein